MPSCEIKMRHPDHSTFTLVRYMQCTSLEPRGILAPRHLKAAFNTHSTEHAADLKLKQRARASRWGDPTRYDVLRDEVCVRVCDRLSNIKRTFPTALDLGANTGNFIKAYTGNAGIQQLHMLDSCREMLYRDEAEWSKRTDVACTAIHADEEGRLPFEDNSLDLVVSCMSLHWLNNLPGVLAEVLRVLKPDGVFSAAMIGGDSLAELRSAFVLAQTEREGGVSPHTSPMVGVADAGNLLTGAGFAIPTIDVDTLAIEYPDAASVMEHLRGMGESNASLMMKYGARPGTFLAAAAAYQALYGDAEGVVPATYQIIYMIGWKPAASQPKPLRRGSVPKGFSMRETSVALPASDSSNQK